MLRTFSLSSFVPLLSPPFHNCQRVSRFVITFAASLISFLTTFLSTVIPFTVRIRRDRSLLTIGPNSHSLKFCYIFNECTACIIVFNTINRYNFGIDKKILTNLKRILFKLKQMSLILMSLSNVTQPLLNQRLSGEGSAIAARRNPGYLRHIASTSCLVIVGERFLRKILVTLCKGLG